MLFSWQWIEMLDESRERIQTVHEKLVKGPGLIEQQQN